MHSSEIVRQALAAHHLYTNPPPGAPPGNPSAILGLQDAVLARIRLASLLGCPTEYVTAVPDRLRGATSPHRPLRLAAADPATNDVFPWRFLAAAPLQHQDPFLLLRPCPRCRAEVPVEEIVTRADLGKHLEAGTSARIAAQMTGDAYFQEYALDPGHGPTCTYGQPA